MHGEETAHTLLVEIDGRPLPQQIAASLAGGYVDTSMNVPDLFVLTFSDNDSTLLAKAGIRIGSRIKLGVQSSGPGGPRPLMSGEVTAFDIDLGADGTHTVVRGLDHSHRLFRGRRVEAYIQMTAADIAAKVAQRAGLAVGVIDHKGPVLQHVTQGAESDWDFLHRLAIEVGATVAAVNGALDFRAPTDAGDAPATAEGSRRNPLVIERGVNLVSLRATVTSSDQVPEVEVRGWDVATKKELVAIAPAATRSADLGTVDPAALASTFRSPRWVEPAPRFATQRQCEAAANALAERLAGSFAELDGIARGNPHLRAGAAVSLTKVGMPFEGRYTLSSSRHEFDRHTGYRTWFTVSSSSERSTYGVATGAQSSTVAMPGVLTATVTDVKDPEDKARVKVHFPVLSGSYDSWWARTVHAGAGDGRGITILPEVGDEVLVAFGLGHVDEPYVLGGLFNGIDRPAGTDHVGTTDGLVQRRVIASRTGMLIEMVEKAGDERLTISTNRGAQQVTLSQSGDGGIKIVAHGPVTVQADKDVTVSAGQKLSLSGGTEIDLSAPQIKINAQASAEIAAADAKLTGSATVEIQGGLVKIN